MRKIQDIINFIDINIVYTLTKAKGGKMKKLLAAIACVLFGACGEIPPQSQSTDCGIKGTWFVESTGAILTINEQCQYTYSKVDALFLIRAHGTVKQLSENVLEFTPSNDVKFLVMFSVNNDVISLNRITE